MSVYQSSSEQQYGQPYGPLGPMQRGIPALYGPSSQLLDQFPSGSYQAGGYVPQAYPGVPAPRGSWPATTSGYNYSAAALADTMQRLQLNTYGKDYNLGFEPHRHGQAFFPEGFGRVLQERHRNQIAPGPRGGRGNGAARGNRTEPKGRTVSKKKHAVQKGLEENVRRTVYICEIDQQVTEEQLASVFQEGCSGQVVDCRVCGDPNSAMRFAFIEFNTVDAAKQALQKNGTVLGSYPLRVLPSKTAIVPVNNEYLPRSANERELCSRTVYVAHIDKQVDQSDVKSFFETLCGPVNKIRLLGDYHHATRIAFVEFVKAESAQAALNCSGALLGSLPVRVSPSKTPVRTESSTRGEE
ncbi:hypothetical protein WJX72_008309 [[Myrmecia] bisecta]|uniref:RRM domain-containing protein n=1 Tax=[Myrmecia] bisecta TaxID=41462 RepID=A0AAW1PP43_9CHLO